MRPYPAARIGAAAARQASWHGRSVRLLTNSWVCRLWPSLLISYPYGTERPAFDIRGAVPGGAASQGGKRSGGGRENVQRFPGDTFPVAAEIRPGRSCRAGDEEDAGAGIPAQPDAIV